MATEKEIEKVLASHRELISRNFWKRTDMSNSGLGAVIRCLMRHEGQVTAGIISEEAHVSTARVAVLLNRLEKNRLVKRVKSKEDGRITIVELTEDGVEAATQMKNNIYKETGKLIDEFGFEELIKYMQVKARMMEIIDFSKFTINID